MSMMSLLFTTNDVPTDVTTPDNTNAAPPMPEFRDGYIQVDDISYYLTQGYWVNEGADPHKYDTRTDNTITVNIRSLTFEGAQLAQWALEAWEAVADVKFQLTPFAADITFDDNQSGAFASSSWNGAGYTSESDVNVGTGWLALYGTKIGSYSFLTYVHEIGHALGLGHAGPYNGGGSYGSSALFTYDSWQASVMSYWAQDENPNIDADYATPVTAMPADILAMQRMYGEPGAESLTYGDTVYGAGHSLGASYLGLVFDALAGSGTTSSVDGGPMSFVIYDLNGRDRLDFSYDTNDQIVDLRAGAVSDVNGLEGSMIIANNTVIEDFSAGSGDDAIIGNEADNQLEGNDGDDLLFGAGGMDVLFGGAGADDLRGGEGADTVNGGDGNDLLDGGVGSDQLNGDAGNDTIYGRQDDDVLNGGDGNDTAYGDDGADIVYGGFGNDRLFGGAGKDFIYGEGGHDILYGGDRRDYLFGGGKNDQLFGNDGYDRLFGNGGNDTLDGGIKNDRLTGGSDADTFIFSSGYGLDRIRDFEDDIDTLHLNDNLWTGTMTVQELLDAFGAVVDTSFILTFDTGDVLTMNWVTDADVLLDDITII